MNGGEFVVKRLNGLGSLSTSLDAMVVKNSLKQQATLSLSKQSSPSISITTLASSLDFLLYPSDFKFFHSFLLLLRFSSILLDV